MLGDKIKRDAVWAETVVIVEDLNIQNPSAAHRGHIKHISTPQTVCQHLKL